MTRPNLFAVAACLLLAPLQNLSAQGETAPDRLITEQQAKVLPGIYYLRGQMETASGLRLEEDGSFDWYLVVGALDLFAKGKWSLQDDVVVLDFMEFQGNDPDESGRAEQPINIMRLRQEEDNLVPEEGFEGVYVRSGSKEKADETEASE